MVGEVVMGAWGALVDQVDMGRLDIMVIVLHLVQVAMEVRGEMEVMVEMVGLGDQVEGEEMVAMQAMVVCLLSRLLIQGCWFWWRQTA